MLFLTRPLPRAANFKLSRRAYRRWVKVWVEDGVKTEARARSLTPLPSADLPILQRIHNVRNGLLHRYAYERVVLRHGRLGIQRTSPVHLLPHVCDHYCDYLRLRNHDEIGAGHLEGALPVRRARLPQASLIPALDLILIYNVVLVPTAESAAGCTTPLVGQRDETDAAVA